MSDGTALKRRMSGRDRRESTAKRRASSPVQPVAPSTPSTSKKASTPVASAATEPRQKRSYTKRASQVRVQTPVSRDSPSASVDEDVLPTKIAADQPLPTMKEKQATDLSLKEYQSISESAILAASLHRSRMQWLHDGVFEKYWVKPYKRKGIVQQPPNNPEVKSMSKLGVATITIEPHTFDAVFYVVRDPAAPQPVYPRHPNQHTPKAMLPQLNPSSRPTGMYPPPMPYQSHPSTPPIISRPPPVPHQSHPANPHPSSGSPPATNPIAPVPPAPLGHANPPPTPQQPPSASPTPAIPVKRESTMTPSPAAPPPTAPRPAVPTAALTAPPDPPKQHAVSAPVEKPNSQPSTKASTPDPVIQMLAARAASDSRLKELMKVVATSKASQVQLKEFQAHIDEFNQVIRKQEAERSAKAGVNPAPKSTMASTGSSQQDKGTNAKAEVQPATPKFATPKPPTPAQSPAVPVSTSTPGASHPPAYKPQPKPTPPPPPQQQVPPPGAATLPGVMHRFPPAPSAGPGRPMTGYMGYPPPPAPPAPRPEPVIKHVVFEITSAPSATQSACPDRWLFPAHAVLEIRPSGLEMLCSFLVEKKGTETKTTIGGGGDGESTADDETGSGSQSQGKSTADKEYYQPVTMMIKVTQHKTIATIAQAAKPLATVQGYMKEVMTKKERAPSEFLVHQLPREKSEVVSEGVDKGFVDSGVEIGSASDSEEEDELKDVYGI